MKISIKNRKRVLISVALIAAIVVILALYLSSGAPAKPLGQLEASNIEYVDVCLMNGNNNMTRVDDPVQISEIVAAAHAVVATKETPAESYAGTPVGYFVHMKTGEEVTFDTGNPYMKIDGEWYKALYDPVEALDQLGQNIMKTGYADISYDIGSRPFADLDTSRITEVRLSNGLDPDCSIEDPAGIQSLTDIMREIVVVQRSARFSESPDLYSDYDYYVNIDSGAGPTLSLTVKNPYILMYGYTYTIDAESANALDAAVRPYLS